MTREDFEKRRETLIGGVDHQTASRLALMIIVDLLANLCDEKNAWYSKGMSAYKRQQAGGGPAVA